MSDIPFDGERRRVLADGEASIRWMNTAAFVFLAIFIAAAPFPYGAVTPTATFYMTASAFLIAALAFASRPLTQKFGLAVIPLLAMALIAIVGVVQLVPMKSETLQRVAPLGAKVYADANEILVLFDRKPLVPKVSIAPAETKATILLTLSYAALFCAAAILCSTRARRRIVTATFLASAAVHLLYSTATTGGNDRLRGTFINPNHFAGYLEIALALAFALVWRELLHNRERGEGVPDMADRLEKRAIPLLAPILLWGVMAAGIGLTRSRGGILAAAITTVLLLMIAPFHKRRYARKRAMAVAAILALSAGMLFVAFTTGEAPLLRFLSADPRDLGSDSRLDLWSAAVKAWESSPMLGSGLGTFRESFRRTQPKSIVGLVEQAHNDFLQMLVTGGWIGATLVAIAIGSILVLLVRGWMRQEHREESAFALAGIGALLSLLLHGIVEFNMSIPAIPATLAVILGMTWAAATWKPAGLRGL